MAIIRDRVIEEDTNRELFSVGDTVKLIESPLDRLKKSAKGEVMEIKGDLAADPHTLVLVRFRVAKANFLLQAEAGRFRFTKHPKGTELPDAEAAPNVDEVEAE